MIEVLKSIFWAMTILDVLANLLLLMFIINEREWDILPEFFNPVNIYNNYLQVNYFGCFMIMLAYHVLLMPLAVCYWVYMLGRSLIRLFIKLCTIGRR